MGQWPSKNFLELYRNGANIANTRYTVSNFENSKAASFINQIKISGQKTVQTRDDLQYIPTALLSAQVDNYNSYPDKNAVKDAVVDGSDAVGQLWWVQDEKCFYQLVKWGSNAPTDNVWAKANINSASVDDSGNVVTKSTKINTDDDKYKKFITSITINADGTYSYTADTLHIKQSLLNGLNSYQIGDINGNGLSTQEFEAISSINWNPDKDSPFNLTYSTNTIKVIGPRHHGGSVEGDFLTSATLSSIGVLTGTSGKFSTEIVQRNSIAPFKQNSTYINTQGIFTSSIDGIPSVLQNGADKIITNAYIDSTAKLHVCYAFPRQWLHDDITAYNDDLNVWLTYFVNGKEYVSYLPVANIAYINNTYTYNSGIMSGEWYEKYEKTIKDIKDSIIQGSGNTSDLSNTITTYNKDTNIRIDNLSSYTYNSYSYVRDFINNHALLDSVSSYQGSNWTYLGYNVGGKLGTSYWAPASATNQGPLSAYTYSFFDDYLADIENRLTGKEKTYTLPSSSGTVTWTVYKADGSTVLKTYTSSSITVEYGCYVSASGIHPVWTYTNGNAKLTSTSGSWGTTVPTLTNNKYTFDDISISKQQLKQSSISRSQSVTGVTLYGVKSFVIDGYGKLVRKDATNKSTSNSFTFSCNDAFGTIKWWGAVADNPSTWTGNVTSKLPGLKSSNGNNNNAKKIVISGADATTSTSKKYFVYIYRSDCGTLSSASVPGADATKWFNTATPKTVQVTSSTNGYTDNYYLVYSLNENALAGAQLTFE